MNRFTILIAAMALACSGQPITEAEDVELIDLDAMRAMAPMFAPADLDMHPPPLEAEPVETVAKSLNDCPSVTSNWDDYRVIVERGTGAEDINAFLSTNRCGKFGPVGTDAVRVKVSTSFDHLIRTYLIAGIREFFEDVAFRGVTFTTGSSFDVEVVRDNNIGGLGRYDEDLGSAEMVMPLNSSLNAGLPASSALAWMTDARIRINENRIQFDCQPWGSGDWFCEAMTAAFTGAHEVAHYMGLNHNSISGGTITNDCGQTVTRRSKMLSTTDVDGMACGTFWWSAADRARARVADAFSGSGQLTVSTGTCVSANCLCNNGDCSWQQ